MNLFTENHSLRKINEELDRMLQEVKIIGDIDISQGDFDYIAKKLKNFVDFGYIGNLFKKSKAAMTVFIVFCAVYDYDNSFWSHVEDKLGITIKGSDKKDFVNIFISVLRRYNLPTFSEEGVEGYKYVTPILCHAGIPIQSIDGFFSLMQDTLYNSSFYSFNFVDELKSLMSYRSSKPIQRYINFLGDDAEEYLFNIKNLMVEINDKNSTTDEIKLKYDNIPTRFIKRYKEWKESSKNIEIINSKKNIRVNGPKVKLDYAGIGIYMILPEQHIKKTYDDCIKWSIIYNDDEGNNKIIESDLLCVEDGFVSKEKMCILKPASSYSVNLSVDGKEVFGWNFEGFSKNIMCFNSYNNLVKKDKLPVDDVTIIFNKNYELATENNRIIELNSIEGWGLYKFYNLNLKKGQNLELRQIDDFDETIKLEAENVVKPYLTKGVKLFEISSTSNNYTELPTLNISDEINLCDIEIHVKNLNSGNEVVKNLNWFNLESKNELYSISLTEDFICNKDFATYELRIYQRKRLKLLEVINYIPYIDIIPRLTSVWPDGEKGYLNNEFLCRNSKNVKVEFKNAQFVDTIIEGKRDYDKYKMTVQEGIVEGEIILEGRDISFNFKKNIKPILWQWMSENINDIKWNTSNIVISKSEDYMNKALIFTANQNYYKCLNIDINLNDRDGNKIQTYNYKNLINGKVNRLNIGELSTSINSEKYDTLFIEMKIYDEEYHTISKTNLAVIQDGIITSDFSFETIDDDINISWNETGNLASRELEIFNIYLPHEETKVVKIHDNESKLILKDYKNNFKNGKYAVKVKTSESDWLDFDNEDKVFNLNGIKKTFLIQDSNLIIENDIDKYIYNLMYILFKKNEELIFNKIGISNENIDDILAKTLKMYIFVYENIGVKAKKSVEWNKRVNYLFDVIKRFNKVTILKKLIKFNFEEKYFNHFINKLSIYDLKPVNESLISEEHRSYIWSRLSYLGFLIDLRILTEDKEKAVDRILKYVEIKNILDFPEETDIEESMIKFLFNNESIPFILNEELIGSNKEVSEYFNYEFNQNIKFKKIKIDEKQDFYEDYRKNNKDNGTVILKKTYLKLYLDFHKKINDINKINKIEETIDREYRKLNIPMYLERNKKVIDMEVVELLKKRMDDNNYKFYYCGIIIYLNSLMKYSNVEEVDLSKIMSLLISNLKDFAIRDMIIFEIYNRKI